MKYLKVLSLVIVTMIARHVYALEPHVENEYNMGDHNFRVQASVACGDKCELTLIFKNESGEKVSFYKDFLSRHNMTLTIVTKGISSRPLEEFVAIDDTPEGILKIGDGETYTQRLRLSTAFPELMEILKKEELILFWNVDIVTLDRVENSLTYGGFLPLKM